MILCFEETAALPIRKVDCSPAENLSVYLRAPGRVARAAAPGRSPQCISWGDRGSLSQEWIEINGKSGVPCLHPSMKGKKRRNPDL